MSDEHTDLDVEGMRRDAEIFEQERHGPPISSEAYEAWKRCPGHVLRLIDALAAANERAGVLQRERDALITWRREMAAAWHTYNSAQRPPDSAKGMARLDKLMADWLVWLDGPDDDPAPQPRPPAPAGSGDSDLVVLDCGCTVKRGWRCPMHDQP